MERAQIQLCYIKRELKSRTKGLYWIPSTVGSCHPNWQLFRNSKRKQGGIIIAAFTFQEAGQSRKSNLRALTILDNHWEHLTRRDLCSSCIWEVLVVSGISLWRRASSKRFIALWHRRIITMSKQDEKRVHTSISTTQFSFNHSLSKTDPQSLKGNKKKIRFFLLLEALFTWAANN